MRSGSQKEQHARKVKRKNSHQRDNFECYFTSPTSCIAIDNVSLTSHHHDGAWQGWQGHIGAHRLVAEGLIPNSLELAVVIPFDQSCLDAIRNALSCKILAACTTSCRVTPSLCHTRTVDSARDSFMPSHTLAYLGKGIPIPGDVQHARHRITFVTMGSILPAGQCVPIGGVGW